MSTSAARTVTSFTDYSDAVDALKLDLSAPPMDVFENAYAAWDGLRFGPAVTEQRKRNWAFLWTQIAMKLVDQKELESLHRTKCCACAA